MLLFDVFIHHKPRWILSPGGASCKYHTRERLLGYISYMKAAAMSVLSSANHKSVIDILSLELAYG
jgi:hypothetical protein